MVHSFYIVKWTGALNSLCVFGKFLGDVAFTETEDHIVSEIELSIN